jgi:CHASE3 domain sensor protein
MYGYALLILFPFIVYWAIKKLSKNHKSTEEWNEIISQNQKEEMNNGKN